MNNFSSSIPLLLASFCMASILSSCSSTTSGPNTTTATEGQGRIVYMNTTLSPNPTSSSVVITDSTGTTSTTLGAGFVWSVAANRIVWDSTGGHDLDDGKGDATIMISTNSGVNKAVWKSSQAVRLASMPIISPDGLHVAFITEENTIRLHVFDVASDGMSITNDRVIDSAIHDKIMPSFSPDGSKIAYYSHIGSNQFLTIRQLNGTAIAQIPNGEDQGNIPGNVEWSPSGDKIAFGADGVIRVVNADGSNPIAVDSGGDPDWSPDGKTIAYESPYFPGHAITDIVLTSNDGATKDTLPNPSHELRFMPAWSPDGEKIICTTGSTSIEVIDVASGAAKTIASPGFTGAWLR